MDPWLCLGLYLWIFETYKENTKFDWSIFRKDTIKIYFDALYGLDKERFKNLKLL